MRRVVRFGESAFLVEPVPTEDPYELIREINAIDEVDEVLAGPQVLVKLLGEGIDSVQQRVRSIPARSPSARRGRIVEMPVVFDGPDLEDVARSAGMSGRDVAAAIAGSTLRVAYLGFSPGFAYVEGLPSTLSDIRRRSSPRTVVPAGSVAIAGGYLGVYPRRSPGGWNLLGRTDLELFDPLADPFSAFQPGDRVRVVHAEAIADTNSSDLTVVRPRCGSSRRVVVEEPGPFTTLQDAGRKHVGHLGVPAAGPADAESMRLANLVAGNPELSGALEITVHGPVLRFDDTAYVVVVGAGVSLDGRSVPTGAAVEVPAGGRLKIGLCTGLRGYVAVSGGLRGPELFGSLSSDQLSGLGAGPLQVGDQLGIGAGGHPRGYAPGLIRQPSIRILPGPVPVERAALAAWATEPFRVSSDSNRIGVRLEGSRPVETSEHPRGSHGMVHGAVQIPPSGEPIVLLCDHATMGGYPVVATVISADLGALAQRRPGESVQFEIVDLEQAMEARSALDRLLVRAPTGLYPSGEFS